MFRLSRVSRSLSVWTTMPSRTGVVQEAGKPFWPSTSQRQSRQEPNGAKWSDEQSPGMAIPAFFAAP